MPTLVTKRVAKTDEPPTPVRKKRQKIAVKASPPKKSPAHVGTITLNGKPTKLRVGSSVNGKKPDPETEIVTQANGQGWKLKGPNFNVRGKITNFKNLGNSSLCQLEMSSITMSANAVEKHEHLNNEIVVALNDSLDVAKDAINIVGENMKGNHDADLENWTGPVKPDGTLTVLFSKNHVKDTFAVEQISKFGFKTLKVEELVGNICCVSIAMSSYVKNPTWPSIRCWVQTVERLYELDDSETTAETVSSTVDPEAVLFGKKW